MVARVQGRDGLIIRRLRFFLLDAPCGVTVPVLGRLTWPAGPLRLATPFELTCIHVAITIAERRSERRPLGVHVLLPTWDWVINHHVCCWNVGALLAKEKKKVPTIYI